VGALPNYAFAWVSFQHSPATYFPPVGQRAVPMRKSDFGLIFSWMKIQRNNLLFLIFTGKKIIFFGPKLSPIYSSAFERFLSLLGADLWLGAADNPFGWGKVLGNRNPGY
jgi:hypothetical protein